MGGCDQDLLLPLDVDVTKFCEGAVVAIRFAVCRCLNLYLESLAVLTGLQNCKESKDVLCLLGKVDFFFFFVIFRSFYGHFQSEIRGLQSFRILLNLTLRNVNVSIRMPLIENNKCPFICKVFI